MGIDGLFLRQLKNIDEKLNVGFNTIKNRYQVVRENRWLRFEGRMANKPLFQTCNKPYFILTVENDDGSYRELDQRTIDKLRSIDVYTRYPRIEDFIRELEEGERDNKERQERKTNELIEGLTKENLHQISDGVEELRGLR